MDLYNKFLDGLCTPNELTALYREFDTADEGTLRTLIEAEMIVLEAGVASQQEEQKLIQLKALIDQRIQPAQRLWTRLAAASVIVILAAATYYFSLPRETQPAAESLTPVEQGVYLTLGNGEKLRLDKGQSHATNSDGTVTDQTGTLLTYGPGDQEQQHTLTNNSNKKYEVVLADGSEVYLDVSSSITYPVSFNGNERRISLLGQAYFKVKHDASKPFRVVAGDQLIEDIGTEFNVDAFGHTRTTLIEGAIRVHAGELKIDLKPGEAAQTENHVLKAEAVNPEMATIWLQGKIPLNHRTLAEVLTEVERIYDVQFNWPDASLKQLRFGGAVSRTQRLQHVLDFFRKTGKVDFRVTGKTITVIKINY